MLEEQKTQQGVQSLEIGLHVLNVLVDAQAELMLKDIAIAAQMHPAKVHRYLVSLVRMGYVRQNQDGLYGLGSSSLRLGLSGLDRLNTLQLAQPYLKKLHTALDDGVLVAKWTAQGPLVLQWMEPDKPLMIVARIGSIMPLLTSATGRVFASYLPEQEIRPMLDKEWAQAKTNKNNIAPANWNEFVALRDQILRERVACVEGVLLLGVHAVAAPVFNHDGELELVLTGLGHARDFVAQLGSPQANLISETAQQISAQLGYDEHR